MSGQTKFVFDTNAVLALLKGAQVPEILDKTIGCGKWFISVVTRIELFTYPNLTAEEETKIRRFLKKCRVIPLNRNVETIAIKIRRNADSKLKLPDAIIAATALMLNATLLSNDIKLLNTKYPMLTVIELIPQ
jgi:predicted nucleic acid-binding protein